MLENAGCDRANRVVVSNGKSLDHVRPCIVWPLCRVIPGISRDLPHSAFVAF
jgi:hypothetical protein